MNANESRPEAAIEDLAGRLITPNSTETLDITEVFFRDSYAVLVRGKTVRRHIYLNLPAATRTVARARARGDRADMILVRLVPVDTRHLDKEVDQ